MGPILLGIKERKYMEILSDSLDTFLWLCKLLSWGGGENSWATVLKVHKQEQNIKMTSQWHLFFFESNLPFNLEHLKTLQKGVASQRHSPKNSQASFSFLPSSRWCATSCVDVWNRPWRWFGTWCKLRILEANAGTGDGQKCEQNGHKFIWQKTLYNNEWV